MKQNKSKQSKKILQINDVEYDLLNIKIIESDIKCIFIEEKPKGFVILVSKSMLQYNDELVDIHDIIGFTIINNGSNIMLYIIGTKIEYSISICTKLNITNKFIFIEQIDEDNEELRLTFTKPLIDSIQNNIEIKIKDEQ